MKFQIKVGGGELFRFNIRHTYHSFSGVIGLLLSVGALAVAALTWADSDGMQKALLIFIGCYYTVLHPLMLRSRANETAKKTEMFQEPMEYEFQETGFGVRQGEAQAFYQWEQIARVIDTKKDVILYMDKVHAHILPKDQLNGRAEALTAYLQAHLPKGKIR